MRSNESIGGVNECFESISPSTEKSFSLPWFDFVWVLPCVGEGEQNSKKNTQ